MEARLIKVSNGLCYKVYEKNPVDFVSATIISISDLACDHTQYDYYVDRLKLMGRLDSIQWIHIDIPGQSDRDTDLVYNKPDRELRRKRASISNMDFPSVCVIVDGVVEIIKKFKLESLFIFGEGMGANFLLRVALKVPQLIAAGLLSLCSDQISGPLQIFKDKILKCRVNPDGSDVKTRQFLLEHRYNMAPDSGSQDLATSMNEFKVRLSKKNLINFNNIMALAQVYSQRTSMLEEIEDMSWNLVLLSGSLSVHANGSKLFYKDLIEKMKIQNKIELFEYKNVLLPLVEKKKETIEKMELILNNSKLDASKL